jgi:hypothetical protein
MLLQDGVSCYAEIYCRFTYKIKDMLGNMTDFMISRNIKRV